MFLRGSASKDLLPNALGPYSALPLATPHIELCERNLAIDMGLISRLISYPR